MNEVRVYTDGACSGNPGPGGWGVLIIDGDCENEVFGGESETTNNRKEMLAAIKALETVNAGTRIILYTDSRYLKDGVQNWMPNWKRNGWKTSARKPVKNRDLWVRLDELAAQHDIEWRWVQGYAGDPGNERADALARRGARNFL